ncbi:HAD family hydrolase [Algibacter sp. L1A34]|uniref:HAD family hydrolase n=1 Tax=Algibacter sp. L1A34 TaxID=2686365 RepID=UPI00131E483C|nr:HAD family hydrolase [Algibacter sp. L1A34]
MPVSKLKLEIQKKEIKILFTDYFDTLVHRDVHPNYVIKIWAKHMIREFGLNISIETLYFIRQEAVSYLSGKLNKNSLEIEYDVLKGEVYSRLVNNDIICDVDKKQFFDYFEKADLKSETGVQYLNSQMIDFLRDFNKNGGTIYLVSDFYGSISLFKKMLKYHGVLDLFKAVFSSSSLGESKQKGTIYGALTSNLLLDSSKVLMVGDNKVSDYDNAIKSGLNACLLPHQKYLRKNQFNKIGNENKKLKKIIKKVYKNCNKKDAMPFTEYILFYHFFAERLYNKCKKDGVKNLFFLSREGQFLKRIFDSYQKYHGLSETFKTNSHYLKISRQAAMQISLKELDSEGFSYLLENYPEMTLSDFFTFLNCPQNIKLKVVNELNLDLNMGFKSFFESDDFNKLKLNVSFKSFYDKHRKSNISAFKTYVESFDVQIEKAGMHIVDIGWGGTMQDALYQFFQEEIPVIGYYLGVKENYGITESTKRYGLLFSILPYSNYDDNILKANSQYYEQFASANHGSVVGYSKDLPNYAIEYYNQNEKSLYEKYILEHQNEMFKVHLFLLKQLESICYNQDMVQGLISKKALYSGLFYSNRKLKFIQILNSGFYQNIGTNNVGIAYKINDDISFKKLFKNFLLTPELVFRYVTKIEPVIFKKNRLLARLFPAYFIYKYIVFNRFVRFNILTNRVLLKFIYFK